MLPSTIAQGSSAGPRAYAQIADTIGHWLDEGTLKPGDKVTITDLAEDYRVNRRTAARGLHVLAGEGRLRRFPGFGYAVQDASAARPRRTPADSPAASQSR